MLGIPWKYVWHHYFFSTVKKNPRFWSPPSWVGTLNFSPQRGRISTTLLVSQPMLVVQKNCKRMKSLSDIPLQSSLWGLFCETTLHVIFLLLCVANLPGFSYMLNCATSYLSINLGQEDKWKCQDFSINSFLLLLNFVPFLPHLIPLHRASLSRLWPRGSRM